MKKDVTLILGASENPSRYSYLALNRLRAAQHRVVAIGKRSGRVGDTEITSELVNAGDIGTVTLYLSPVNQQPYYDYVISLRPTRVIFNPGTENPEFEDKLKASGIQVVEACTLVMLSTGQY